MKRKVFSIFDVVSKVYLPPMQFVHEGEALRAFEDIVLNPQTMVAKHPGDFKLYRLGEFDDCEGVFDCTMPEFISNAVDFVAIKKEPVNV